MFEALAGRRPIAFETLGQMYTAFLEESILSVREALPDLPGDVTEILDRCLVIKPNGRLESLEPFLRTLEPYERVSAGESGIRTPTAANAVRSWHPRRKVRVAAWAGAAALALAASVGLASVIEMNRRVPESTSAPEIAAEVSRSAIAGSDKGSQPSSVTGGETSRLPVSATAAPVAPRGHEDSLSRERARSSAELGPLARAATTTTNATVPPARRALPEVPAPTAKKGILDTPPY